MKQTTNTRGPPGVSADGATERPSGGTCNGAQVRHQSLRRRRWRAMACGGAALLVLAALAWAPRGGVAAPGELAAARLVRQAPGAEAATQAPEPGSSASPTPAGPKRPSKLPPVNFTQVDHLFEEAAGGAGDEQEVLAKWRQMDKRLVEGVRAALKVVFPHVVSLATDAKVSGSCSGAILKWILNLRNMRSWAVKMLDAIGKPSAGILEGSLTMFGNYKQCLSVRAPDEDEIEMGDGQEFHEYFRGQYCVLQLRPPLPARRPFYSLNSTISALQRSAYKYYEKNAYDELAELAMAFNFVHIRADLCVPSLCSRDDIQRVADFLASKVEMRARVARCDQTPLAKQQTNPANAPQSQPAPQQVAADENDEWSLEWLLQLWAILFGALLVLVVLSTMASFAFNIGEKRTKGKAHSLLTSMSLHRSLAHIRHVHLDRINELKPAHLYTLRLVIVLWVLLVGLISQLNYQFVRELLSLRELVLSWPLQILVNSSLQFDALILLTAFTYSFQNVHANLKDLIKYNVDKYSRLMPSIMLIVGLTVLAPSIYDGHSPIWRDFVDEPARVCQSNGFVNLFFLQNLLNYNQICLPQTWLFCVEFQLCILAIPIVYLMNKNFDSLNGRFKLTSFPLVSLIFTALAGVLINAWNVYTNALPAAWFLTFPDKRDRALYFSQHLAKTWSHLSPFAVGLFTGHLCRCLAVDTFSGRPYGRRQCDNLMWFTSLATMAGLVYLTYPWTVSGASHLESPLASALYAGLAPLLWSLSWSLILFHLTVPNSKNQRSPLAAWLNNEPDLIRCGRLTFLAYLIGPFVNLFVLASQETSIFSSPFMLAHTFLGNLVITFLLSLLVSALVELPCRRLIKKLALGSRRQCGNLGLITRQLDIRQQNSGPSHDSFAAGAGPGPGPGPGAAPPAVSAESAKTAR